MGKYLYLAVTTDKYELPLIVEDTALKLANKMGITRGRVNSAIYQNESGKRRGSKIIKIEIQSE